MRLPTYKDEYQKNIKLSEQDSASVLPFSADKHLTYIEVPPTLLPSRPQAGGVPPQARPYPKSTAQRHPTNNEPPRLGSLSINDTPTLTPTPSELAWQSFRSCPPATKLKYGKLLTDFCDYMQMCDNSGFRAEGLAVGSRCKPYPSYQMTPGTGKNDFGKRVVSGPLLNRWHPQRRTAWMARMYRLAEWYEANKIGGCTLISLTGYQENSGLSWYDTLDNIQESRIKLLKILRKYLGKVSYFWVIEPHTETGTGYPHIHLAVFEYIDNQVKDAYGEGMEDKLRRHYSEEWKTGSHTYGLDFQQMKGDKGINDLKNYLMKYISKGYVNEKPWSPGELIFNAHLFGATHQHRPPKEGEEPDFKGRYNKKYRIIGMSNDLSALMKPEAEDKEDIVWLHTDETEPEVTRKDPFTGEDIVICEAQTKQLYHRQLIPDWLSPDPFSFCWGRPVKFDGWGGGYDPTNGKINYVSR